MKNFDFTLIYPIFDVESIGDGRADMNSTVDSGEPVEHSDSQLKEARAGMGRARSSSSCMLWASRRLGRAAHLMHGSSLRDVAGF